MPFGRTLGDKDPGLRRELEPELHCHAIWWVVRLPHLGKRLTSEGLNVAQGLRQGSRQPPEYLPAPVTYRSQILNLPGDLGKYRFAAS